MKNEPRQTPCGWTTHRQPWVFCKIVSSLYAGHRMVALLYKAAALAAAEWNPPNIM
ncbi:hypothetical protein [Desulfogranum marinum]|uniref:hypothetical protein n=1 Tax=Desulfogranum marinum TaxID=453220 RepID=UPI001963B8F0|nr:hypothetical protein [Desulfogranum marinum]MBM9514900.1 hypothetical protein [Desulfogranum marinum]